MGAPFSTHVRMVNDDRSKNLTDTTETDGNRSPTHAMRRQVRSRFYENEINQKISFLS